MKVTNIERNREAIEPVAIGAERVLNYLRREHPEILTEIIGKVTNQTLEDCLKGVVKNSYNIGNQDSDLYADLDIKDSDFRALYRK